ncbi:Cystatin/monellin superfamily protein [Raphanus sativus]|uniref:Uncharacterized protein LOC108836714 n=1 Tax=Raphanus sativus TaxID=3726 RepID=A0A6J0LZV4_RAPSA|nr:uncharacterized protein LOC108836714 [Raphanus sativus]KAJ4910744.1 Cystatin/monellin superfamily protein [Raphanus sativus]
MEEDSDTDSGRAWSVDTEDEDGVVRSPRINYLNMRDPEPEWDKDSFDGYEYFNPEDRKTFSDEEEYKEFRDFKIQAWKNGGFFEEDPFRSIFPLPDLEQPFRNMTTREYLADIVSLCVNKLNEVKGSTVEFASIVRGNLKAGDGWKLYITFMAREYPSGPLKEYQAKAMDFAGGQEPPFPILCRPAPPYHVLIQRLA